MKRVQLPDLLRSRKTAVPRLRLRAATLLEVLVSLSLASMTFVIAATIYLQLNGKDNPVRQQEWRLAARQLMDQSVSENDPSDKTITMGAAKLVRTVRLARRNSDLYRITVSGFIKNNKPIFQRQRIARIHAR